MKNVKFLICFILWTCAVSAPAQIPECEIYQLMSPYLKDTTRQSRPLHRHYILEQKKEITKGHLKFLKKDRAQDSLLMWDNLVSIVTKSEKINECKLNIGYTYKFVNSARKAWESRGEGVVMLVIFSEILHYEEKQAFAFVELSCCNYAASNTYYFFFEKENEKWKIRRVVSHFRT